MSSPSKKTLKQLFGRSNNNCAFPRCTIKMIDEESGTVIGEVCHIEAKNLKGPRYNDSQKDEERDSFANLILMCPIHHKIIDDDIDSYSPERLRQIKTNYESNLTNTIETDEKRRRFNELLDRLIALMVDEEPTTDETRAEIHASENSALERAKKLAKDKQNEINRINWFDSTKALADVFNSVNKLFSIIDNYVSEETETFETLEIKLHRQEFLRSIHNRKFGCQIELKGFDKAYTKHLSPNIYFEVVLYSKIPNPLNHKSPYTELISKPRVLTPSINEQTEVVWRLETGELLSEIQLCELFNKLLIDQIANGRNYGGRYIVDGKVVNANGEEIY